MQLINVDDQWKHKNGDVLTISFQSVACRDIISCMIERIILTQCVCGQTIKLHKTIECSYRTTNICLTRQFLPLISLEKCVDNINIQAFLFPAKVCHLKNGILLVPS
ncbi:CLUMA_CG013722, isoform A [Clunio marinus]|uniref:CLUMA_CG013722, isoform A n=1 Tax=Clunio marinus TaxID=568069 RepID=A0A1J1IJP8_9DIPT|nr:CLUMA_CG013722, isoform A [Clunio marinus]